MKAAEASVNKLKQNTKYDGAAVEVLSDASDEVEDLIHELQMVSMGDSAIYQHIKKIRAAGEGEPKAAGPAEYDPDKRIQWMLSKASTGAKLLGKRVFAAKVTSGDGRDA